MVSVRKQTRMVTFVDKLTDNIFKNNYVHVFSMPPECETGRRYVRQ